jgi:predicted phosphate transport protein (TIGR00153 family)
MRKGLTMARKKDENYFDTFVELAGYSCKAAALLNNIVHNYNAEQIPEKMKEMHAIEHDGDEARHRMIKRLAREFITPIEREDIMAMADYIDTVTDTIEDVLMRMYMYNIRTVSEYALKMTEVIVKCCESLKIALDEFYNFRKSQKLHNLIIEINRLEEVGDDLFMKATRDLYVNCPDYRDLSAWDTTYYYFEKCCDSCEDVANVIENVIMKNS